MYMKKLGNFQQENEKEKNSHCIFSNEMQIEEISAPVLTNTLKGQMHEAEQLLISETTLSLSSQINQTRKKEK